MNFYGGRAGKNFSIYKVYPTREAMANDFKSIPMGAFCSIGNENLTKEKDKFYNGYIYERSYNFDIDQTAENESQDTIDVIVKKYFKFAGIFPENIIDNFNDIKELSLISEGYANGEQNGVPVSKESSYYENNAKYYQQEAKNSAKSVKDSQVASKTSALISEGYAVGTQDGNPSEIYEKNNSKYYTEQARNWATFNQEGKEIPDENNNAYAYAQQAKTQALISEGYTTGTQNNQEVLDDSLYYQNNAKYYKNQAEEWAIGTKDGSPSEIYKENNSKYWADVSKNYAQRSDTETEPGAGNSAQAQAEKAAASEQNANTSSNRSEKWATGLIPTGGDPKKGQSAREQAEIAAGSAGLSEEWATGKESTGQKPGKGESAKEQAEVAGSSANRSEKWATGLTPTEKDPISGQSAREQAEAAAGSATLAKKWAVSLTNEQEPGETNNAQYYAEQAKNWAIRSDTETELGIGNSAQAQAEKASASAELAKKWAALSTNMDIPSNTNNAEYYAQQAKNWAIRSDTETTPGTGESAQAQAELAKTYADFIKNMDVSAETGETSNVQKTINNNKWILEFTLEKGEKGNYWRPEVSDQGLLTWTDSSFSDTSAPKPINIRGPRGESGEGFKIYKIYNSIEAMNGDFSNPDIPFGAFVMVNTEDVESEDNAKLYTKGTKNFEFTVDMSGARGIQGPRGYDFQYQWIGTELGVKSSDQDSYQTADLKGDPLEIYASHDFTEKGNQQDDTSIRAELNTKYLVDGKATIKANKILNVTYKDKDGQQVYYWYYYQNNELQRTFTPSGEGAIVWGEISQIR